MSALSFPLCVTALTLVLGGQIFAGQAVARDYGQQGAVWPVIEPDLARGIGERISALIAERGPAAPPVALIVQPRARRPLAALLRLRAPNCQVMSISELPPSQPIEVISVVGGEAPPQPARPELPIPEGLAA